MKDTKSIVYIPGGVDKLQKVIEKYVPAFTKHFNEVGIEFESSIIVTPNMTQDEAKEVNYELLNNKK